MEQHLHELLRSVMMICTTSLLSSNWPATSLWHDGSFDVGISPGLECYRQWRDILFCSVYSRCVTQLNSSWGLKDSPQADTIATGEWVSGTLSLWGKRMPSYAWLWVNCPLDIMMICSSGCEASPVAREARTIYPSLSASQNDIIGGEVCRLSVGAPAKVLLVTVPEAIH